MGTDGFAGFAVDGVEKIFCHFKDSYPSGLGVAVLDWLTRHRGELAHPVPGGIVDRVRALRLLTDEPTPVDVERIRSLLRDRADSGWIEEVSDEELVEMTTGDLDLLLEAGIVVDGSDCPMDSLFTEWGYLIDLDVATFEVFGGFQRAPHTAGRFALRPSTRELYYPVALVAAWSLADLPDRDGFLALFAAY